MPTKLSASQVHAVLSEVPDVLRSLVTERDDALQKLAAAEAELGRYRTNERLNKLATKMEERGFQTGLTAEDRMEFLSKKAEAGQLEAIEQAVDMSAPQQPLGWLGETGGNAADELTSYCMGELVE